MGRMASLGNINMRVASLAICLGLVFLWFMSALEVEPHSATWESGSSRFNYLNSIVESSNKGYHLQVAPGIPMESKWEDPGFMVLTVFWGGLKAALGYGKIDIHEDPYVIQFLLLVPFVFLLHSKWLFRLSRIQYATLSLFFLTALLPWWDFWGGFPNVTLYNRLPDGLLYLSISTRWAKVMAIVWVFAMVMTLWSWTREGRWVEIGWKGLVGRVLVWGLVIGLLGTIRRDSITIAALALTLSLGVSFLWQFFSSDAEHPPKGIRRNAVRALMILVLFGLSTQIPKAGIYASWAVRDQAYEMKPGGNRTYGHPAWDILYISLGFVKNDLGIKWLDAVGYEHISASVGKPHMPTMTDEYTAAARNLYLKTISEHPGLLWRNMVAKAKRLYKEQRRLILTALAALAGLIVLPATRWQGGILAAVWACTCVLPVLIYPYISYYLGFVTAAMLIILYGGLMISQAMFNLVKRGASSA